MRIAKAIVRAPSSLQTVRSVPSAARRRPKPLAAAARSSSGWSASTKARVVSGQALCDALGLLSSPINLVVPQGEQGKTMFDRRGNIWDDFDREFQEMDRMMDRMLAQLRRTDWSHVPTGQPVYYGVSVDVGPDGVPRVQQFGNVTPQQGLLESGVREPFVTSFMDDENDQLRVTAEMPGVDKKSIKVEVQDDALVLRAEGEDRKYEKMLRLTAPVDADSAKARYNNGVLEVTLDLKKPAKPKGRDVKVE